MSINNIITQYVFVDEYGNNSLNIEKQGVSKYYIFVGILLAPDKIPESAVQIKSIQKKFFSGSPIKSSNVGSNDKRRIKILQEIIKIDFTYYSFIVNKEKLDRNSGLQYKTSFYKNLHNHFYRHIAEFNTDISIIVDEYGNDEFRKSFEKYISTQSKPNLFSRIYVSVANDQDKIQIQVADFIAGTLARIYDPSVQSQPDTFFQLLKSRKLRHEFWPPSFDKESIDTFLKKHTKNEYDEEIARNAVQQALGYMKKFDNDPEHLFAMQAEVLREFLNLRIDEGRKDAITADELMNHLQNCGYDVKGKQYFTSKIIGGLRDKHMIIAGNNDGYRLALDTSDIKDYLKHDRAIIEPMLSRLEKADVKIKSLTNNKLDISKLDSSKLLSKMLDVYTNSKEPHIMEEDELFYGFPSSRE